MSEKQANPFFGASSNKPIFDKLSGRFRKSWVEASFHFDGIQGRNIPLPKTAFHIKSSITQRKIVVLLTVSLVFFSLVIGRVFFLQIIKGGEYRTLAEGNRQRIIPIPAERGLIYDKTGLQLTKNIPKFSLALVPQDLPRGTEDRRRIVERLAEITGQEIEEIRDILNKYGSYSYESIIIKENLDYETALSIQIAAADLPGINITRGSKRLYFPEVTTSTDMMRAKPSTFSHILGYLGKLSSEELTEMYSAGYLPSDDIGKVGVEKSYEDTLKGVYGKRRIEVDALGREQSLIAEESPQPGNHVYLSVDIDVQENLERIVRQYLALHDKERAAAVVMDPNNGAILALVSIPSFDNNHFSGGIGTEVYQKYLQNKDKPLFNRAIGGTYPSGSTIKPAIAAASLQEGIIDSNTSFNSNGGLWVSEWFFPDWRAGGHGITNVTKAIALSVNTFFYYVGGGHGDFKGLGVEKITEYLRKFGFGKKLGIDLPGESRGFLPSIEWKTETKGESWYIGDTYNLSIGQGDLLSTPLQIAAMTASVANDGKLYKPHVVESIQDPITGEFWNVPVEEIRSDFIHHSHLQTVRTGMRECVTGGSCALLSNLSFETAGKTGTAQWSSVHDNHAWFTSFAPYQNPEVVVTVLVEEGEEGSKISVPIAYDFYKWWWSVGRY
jgi:penicillin-binding protein 2